MNTICETITGLGGVFLIYLAFIMKTENLRSAMFFKFVPFILGMGNWFVALYLLDIIKLNIK